MEERDDADNHDDDDDGDDYDDNHHENDKRCQAGSNGTLEMYIENI